MTLINVTTSNQVTGKDFVNWMNENIGKFGVEWRWSLRKARGVSVKIEDPMKAVLVALQWGTK